MPESGKPAHPVSAAHVACSDLAEGRSGLGVLNLLFTYPPH